MPRARRDGVAFALLAVLAVVALAAAPAAADPPTGRIRVTPTIDPPGEVSEQAVPHGSTYKVRDGDGKVVAEGGIPGSGGNRNRYQSAEVELPPGKYTVEVYYHTPGDRHAQGTRDYRGDTEVEVKPGATRGYEVEIQPRTPEQHMRDRLQDVDDQIGDVDREIQELEDDIEIHKHHGEDVTEEHTRMLEDLETKKEGLEDRRRGMRTELRRLQDAARRTEAARDVKVPRVRVPTQKGHPDTKGHPH